MPKNAQTIKDLRHAANLITIRPSTDWAGLVLYIIETLELDLDEPEIRPFLQKILDNVQARLYLGEW